MDKEDKTLERYKEYIGETFNRLTILEVKRDEKNQISCRCMCSCDNKIMDKWIKAYNVINGLTKSCGCLVKEVPVITHKKHNTYDLISEDYGIGYTSNTKEPFYFDKEDYDKIKDYCWRSHKTKGYKALESRYINGKEIKTIRFHHLLGKKGWDHINRNPFDNRKSNLRECNYSQNSINKRLMNNNTSGVSGVCYTKSTEVWRAYLTCDGIIYRLGSFKNFDDAVKARLEAEKKYFKEFAPQKHLYKKYGIED